MTTRVLLVDDDLRLRTYVTRYLVHAGMTVEGVGDGLSALALAHRASFDILLLDLTLPGEDGFVLLPELRRVTRAPVILLTARTEEDDRVRGLEGGADDYVTKPFGPRELVARIRVVLRRLGRAAEQERWVVGRLEVDLATRSARADGVSIALTGIEFDLLAALLRHADRVVGRDELRALAGRGDTIVTDRVIDVHIHHLRRKLGLGRDERRAIPRIDTVRGRGYVLLTREAT
jgi:DNA-binding response OmpR family regulator